MNIIEKNLETSKLVPARHSFDVMLKLMEEVGELSVEVAAKSGRTYKKPGKDGILGECCDVMNCALDLIYLDNPLVTPEEIAEVMSTKLEKWKQKTLNPEKI